MATRSPTQHHNYWGIFATTALLPNVAGSPTQKATLEVGDTAYVSAAPAGTYTCTDATLGAAIWISDSAERLAIGPYSIFTAASQTARALDAGVQVLGWVASRAGSVTALSAALSAAVTGANITCQVEKALAATPTVFVAIGATLLTFVAATNVTASITLAPGAQTFAANDVLRVTYTSGVTTNLPSLTATIEVTE